MNHISGQTADYLYKQTLKSILTNGELTHPRGFNCLELSPCHLTLEQPWNNIVLSPARNINKAFAAAEMLWIMDGKDDVKTLDFYNSKIKAFSDNGETFFGAYGPKYKAQMPYILKILKEDPWTRQAVLTIWRESPPKTKDVPCTIMFHFIRRPIDTLNLIVYMRSQDCWLGLPYDLHNFTCFQIITADLLGLKVGTFNLMQGSLHAYEPDFAKISSCISEIIMPLTESTPIDLLDLMHQKRDWMRDFTLKKLARDK